MSRFHDKTYVITGGSSGIGLAAAVKIASEGGKVLITGSNRDKVEASARLHPGIHGIVNDASDLSAAALMATEAKTLFGRIDGAFLNAGKGAGAPLKKLSPQLYRELMDLNVAGPLFGMQALEPLMKDGASVVITASIAKDKGMAGGALYSATKGAVRSMVRGLAREFAPRGIRVNSISPGPIETPFFERLGRTPEQLEQVTSFVVASNPMKRFGSAEEAAAVALFLLSNEASYVTGADYVVDGGDSQL